MKKTMSLLFATIFLIGFTACTSAEEKAYALYVKANENLGSVQSYAAKTDVTIDMDFGSESYSIKTSGAIKQVMHSETDAELEMEISASQPGIESEFTAYYRDGFYYLALDEDNKWKTATPLDELLQQSYYNIDFSETAVKNTVVEKVDEGTKINFTLDGNVLNELMVNQLSDMGLDTEGINFSCGDVDMETIIGKDENIKTVDMKFIFSLEQDGQKIDADTHMFMEITQIGNISISPPDDLDSYLEMPVN